MRTRGLRLSALLRLYGWRVRRHPLAELLAAAGIAVGVALAFGVQVANTSIVGSAKQLVDGIRGDATLQLTARSSRGFDERLAARVGQVRDVERTAPLLRTRAVVEGARGRRAIQLVGVTPALGRMGGSLMRNFGPDGLGLSSGLTLPADLAAAVGTRPGRRVSLIAGGRRRTVVVGAVLGEETIGSVVGSPIAVAPLRRAQALANARGSLTDVLVQARPGSEQRVRRGVERIAGRGADVTASDAELDLLRQAVEPNDRATGLFAAIGAMLGCLFAFTAVLLTVPERRRFVAELRVQGFARGQVLGLLAFEAIALGGVASAGGLVLGDVLSRTVFDSTPAYLALAFPIGTQRVVETGAIAIAVGIGLASAMAASALPALDLRAGRAVDATLREPAEAGEALGGGTAPRAAAAAAGLLVATTVVALAVPRAALAAQLALAVASVLTVPAAYALFVRAARRATRHRRRTMAPLALMELGATPTRSFALAAVATLAVFGTVTVEGARRDLVRGLDRTYAEYVSTADVWVTSAADAVFATNPIPGRARTRLERLPEVADVRAYHGAFLDTGGRRVWVIARPRGDVPAVPPSEVREGRAETASGLIARGGWATVSQSIAERRGLGVGDRLELATPAGVVRPRVAALTGNVGWAPGTIVMSSRDFRRAWRETEPTALEVDLEPGVAPGAGRRAVAAALGSRSPLRAQTSAERLAETSELSRQGLTRLSQISVLLLVAAALAVAAAMSAAVAQRRSRLAALKVQGFTRVQLWRALLLETSFVLLVGCTSGAALGFYGHLLLGRWLEVATGFPAPFAPSYAGIAGALAVVAGVALAVSAIPGYLATRVSPRAAFRE
jgi:putative ABC transport system permease protein